MRRRELIAGAATALAITRIGVAAGQTPVSVEFAFPDWLADPKWLVDQLGRDDFALVALMPAEDFAAGHIPGSAQIDWPALEIIETDEASVESWQGEIESILTTLGIDRQDTVVVYDAGSFWAGRLWWILHYLGHADVRILNGGLQAWTSENGVLESGESVVEPAVDPYRGEPDADVIVTIDQAVEAFDSQDAAFVDARTADEFAAGHIPGAVNVPFIANAVAGEAKFWKPAAELMAMYETAGITTDQRVIPYCTTGVRSAVTYFTLRQLGYEDVALFTGSFEEWSSDPERPVESGS